MKKFRPVLFAIAFSFLFLIVFSVITSLSRFYLDAKIWDKEEICQQSLILNTTSEACKEADQLKSIFKVVVSPIFYQFTPILLGTGVGILLSKKIK